MTDSLEWTTRTDSLDWRGKPIRELTPDETHQFAIWALREITRLQQERDGYLDRAIRAENNPVLEQSNLAGVCNVDQAGHPQRACAPNSEFNSRDGGQYDTLAEREMDLGDKFDRLTREDE